MSSATAMESLEAFVDEISMCFADDYLRLPMEADLRKMLSINAARGFPGWT